MAVEVIADVIDGTSLTETKDGVEANRIFIVSGLQGNQSQKLFNALTAPGIPQIGDFHPFIPDVQVIDKNVEAIGTEKVMVDINYRIPSADEASLNLGEPYDVQIGSTAQTVVTQKDRLGNQLLLTHTFESTDSNGNLVETTQTIVGEAEIQIPFVTVSWKTRVDNSGLEDAKCCVGRVNATPLFGDPARFWLFQGLDSFTEDNGLTFILTFQLQRNPDTWNTELAFIDPNTNAPAEGLVDGVGLRQFEIYKEFTFVGITLPDI